MGVPFYWLTTRQLWVNQIVGNVTRACGENSCFAQGCESLSDRRVESEEW